MKEISADKQTQLSYEAWIRDIRMQNCAYDTGRDEGKAEGLAEGETNAKIEAVINLIKKMNITLDQAISILEIDASYKQKIEEKLKELGIKYN